MLRCGMAAALYMASCKIGKRIEHSSVGSAVGSAAITLLLHCHLIAGSAHEGRVLYIVGRSEGAAADRYLCLEIFTVAVSVQAYEGLSATNHWKRFCTSHVQTELQTEFLVHPST